MTERFEGRIALITGAAGRIGLATAQKLAAEGAYVALADLSEQASAGVEQILAAGGRASFHKMDVTSPASITNALDDIEKQADGVIDTAVTAAGVINVYDFLDLPKDSWDFTLNVNLTGTFLVLQAVAQRMVASGTVGKLVAISSISGRSGRPNVVDYAASKAGVISVVRSVALALAPYGITVNGVCPGVVDTDMTRRLHEARAQLAGITIEASLKSMTDQIPLGRIQTPEDVADVVAFLLSAEASYVTGQCINADGGMEMD